MKLKDVVERLNEIRSVVDNKETCAKLSPEEISALAEETKTLLSQETELRNEETKNIQDAINARKEDENMNQDKQTRELELKEIEERCRALKEKRSITLTDNLNLVHVEENADKMVGNFQPLVTLLDLVKIEDMIGCEKFNQPFAKTNAKGKIVAEGQKAGESTPTYSFATIDKQKIVTLINVTEEFEKLGAKAYVGYIEKEVKLGVINALMEGLVSGKGTTNELAGICNPNATAIDASTDITITTIDENTLDDLTYGYKGAKSHAFGVLLLNEQTLRDFAKVRNSNKEKVYKIDRKNQLIDDVPYVFVESLPAFATATTNDYVLAYGVTDALKLVQFSPLTIQKSTDEHFSEGIITYKATGWFGSNVCKWNGFIRAKKQ